jgi:hypothetical protein
MIDYQNAESSVLAFFGGSYDPSISERAFREFCQWFSELGQPPTLVGTSRSSRYKKYSNAIKELSRIGYSDLQSFSIISVPPEVPNEVCGENLYVSVTASKARMILSVRSALADLESDFFRRCAERLIDMVKPHYGIGFRRKFSHGPVWYAMGCEYHWSATERTPEKELKYLGSHASNANGGYYESKGLLSGLFPLNFLNGKQLQLTVENIPLEKWITSDEGHGSLSQFNEDLKLWKLTDQQIVSLGPMFESPLLICDPMYEWELTRTLVDPANAPSTREVVAAVAQAFGFNSPDEVDIVHLEEPGSERQLTDAEKHAIFRKRPRKTP